MSRATLRGGHVRIGKSQANRRRSSEVEQGSHNPCVGGSIPPAATKVLNHFRIPKRWSQKGALRHRGSRLGKCAMNGPPASRRAIEFGGSPTNTRATGCLIREPVPAAYAGRMKTPTSRYAGGGRPGPRGRFPPIPSSLAPEPCWTGCPRWPASRPSPEQGVRRIRST